MNTHAPLPLQLSSALLSAVLVVALPLQPSAQVVLRSWTLHDLRGTRLELLSDIDGDGLPEFLVGNYQYSPPHLDAVGMAYVVMSLDGRAVYLTVGETRVEVFGVGLGSLGDVDGDGTDDYGVSGQLYPAGAFSQFKVFSGRDGKTLFERSHPGMGMAILGDRDGDGRSDFLVGDPPYGVISLVHGGSFEVEHEWNSTGGALGSSIAVLGDVNGDGVADFAAGAPGVSSPFGNWPGKVQVFSGKDFGLLFERLGNGVTEQFGMAVAAPGDLNGDGIGDLVVAGPGCCSQISEFDGPGRLYFFDVAHGTLLGTKNPASGERGYGFFLDLAGDLDGNGVGDVLTFVNTRTALVADVIEGSTRKTIYRVPASTGFAGGGRDWNGDTIPDFVVLLPAGLANEIRLYSGAPVGVSVLGTPCARGPEPRIGVTGSAHLGAELPLHLSQVEPDRLAWLLLGDLPKILPSGPCIPRVQPFRTVSVRTTAVSPGQGAATVSIAIPNDPSLQGRTFHAQWIVPSHPHKITRVLAFEILAP